MAIARHHGHARARAAVLVLLALVCASVGTCLALTGAEPPGTILPGVRIAGIPVGGMSAAEAMNVLDQRVRPQVERPIRIVWDGGERFLLPSDVGISADLDDMVRQASAVGRSGHALLRLFQRYRLAIAGSDIPLRLEGDKRLQRALESLRSQIERPAVDAGFVIEEGDFVRLTPSTSGLHVDVQELISRVLATAGEMEREVVVPVQPLAPALTTAQASAWGINQVVTKFNTRFDAGDANRSHNLSLAAQALSGAVIAPGATFSFNQRVGPRSPKNGYREAPVVLDGELVPDIGGGVCQVSSTLYNAALLAGVRIDYRRPHTVPSTYVPLGQDAAVAYDYIDLRFTNTSSGYLYVKAWISGNRLWVALLGAEPVGPARLVSKVESVKPMPAQEIVDPSLGPGERVVERKGGKGYTVSVWRVSGGEAGESWELINRSTYKPRTQLTRVGAQVAMRAAAGPSPAASADPPDAPAPSG